MLPLSPLWRAPLPAIQLDGLCVRCLRKFSRPLPHSRRIFSTSVRRRQIHNQSTAGISLLSPGNTNGGKKQYFWTNNVLQTLIKDTPWKGWWRADGKQSMIVLQKAGDKCRATEDSVAPSRITNEEGEDTVLPHRRRRRRKEVEGNITNDDQSLPLDASNRLTTLSEELPRNSLRRLFTIYLSLSKPRLSFLIVLTTTAAYSLYPVPVLLQATTTVAPSLSTLTLMFLTTGTFLTCASANALNMLIEPSHDAKMSRTRNRPLVRKLITTRAALLFAIFSGITGTVALYTGVNPTTAFLAALNIALYAGIYTPLKRISVVNTWVGAIVGGIPPLMGWTAAAGQSATGAGDWQELLFGKGSLGGWLLASLLVCWQFPHFNALSWPIREEYKHAGYRMMVWTNPARNGRVALRYSALLFPVCIGLAYVGVVEYAFIPLSSLANGWLTYKAVQFWKWEGQKGSARGLFWASVWHLPVVLVLAMSLKTGLWDKIWRGAVGMTSEDNIWDEDS